MQGLLAPSESRWPPCIAALPVPIVLTVLGGLIDEGFSPGMVEFNA